MDCQCLCRRKVLKQGKRARHEHRHLGRPTKKQISSKYNQFAMFLQEKKHFLSVKLSRTFWQTCCHCSRSLPEKSISDTPVILLYLSCVAEMLSSKSLIRARNIQDIVCRWNGWSSNELLGWCVRKKMRRTNVTSHSKWKCRGWQHPIEKDSTLCNARMYTCSSSANTLLHLAPQSATGKVIFPNCRFPTGRLGRLC